MKITIALFVLFSVAPAGAINYFRCDTTDQCVKAYGGCGRYLSVHSRYKELYEAKAHLADRTANCLPPTERDKQRKFGGEVKCLKQSCRLLLPKNQSPETPS